MFRIITIYLAIFAFACNSSSDISNMQLVGELHNSKSTEEHFNYLHPSFKLYYTSVKSGLDGENLKNLLDSDYALNPVRVIADTIVQTDTAVTVIIHEQNDLSRLIELENWKSRNTFIFKDGKIYRQLYSPINDDKFKGSLTPAITWLLENDSINLVSVYDLDKKKIRQQDAASALKWVELLTKWKSQDDPAL